MQTGSLDLKEEIGSGFFGRVFRAIDVVHGEVAVKELLPFRGEDPHKWEERKEKLLDEGQTLALAKHPNVLKVHYITGAQDDSNDLWLVMELCEGGTLHDLVSDGASSINDVRQVLSDVAQGLESIHVAGMLHRDIKPGNLLRTAGGSVKVGDFGLVTDRLTAGYGSKSDPYYKPHEAPEVAAGSGTSRQSDIWAFGVTAFRLLHGDSWCAQQCDLFSGGGARGFREKLPWLHHVPKPWRTFIRKCLHDNPSARFSNLSGLQNDLAKLPVAPSWSCKTSPNGIEWSRVRTGRRHEVLLNRVSNKWTAVSTPLAKGQRRTLASGNDEAQLRKFFVQA